MAVTSINPGSQFPQSQPPQTIDFNALLASMEQPQSTVGQVSAPAAPFAPPAASTNIMPVNFDPNAQTGTRLDAVA